VGDASGELADGLHFLSLEELLLHGASLVFRADLLADVAGDADDSLDVGIVELVGSEGFHPPVGAIGIAVPIACEDGFGWITKGLGEGRLDGVAVVWMDEVEGRLAQDILLAIAVDFEGGGGVEGEVAFAVEDADDVGGKCGEGAETLLTAVHGGFGELLGLRGLGDLAKLAAYEKEEHCAGDEDKEPALDHGGDGQGMGIGEVPRDCLVGEEDPSGCNDAVAGGDSERLSGWGIGGGGGHDPGRGQTPTTPE